MSIGRPGLSGEQDPTTSRSEQVRQESTLQPVEQKEEGENFELRYDRLARESTEIRREREMTFALASLQVEGLQTLVAEYGASSVLEAINKQSELQDVKERDLSTFDVLRALEPDKGKRASLYQEMLSNAQRVVAKVDGDIREGRGSDVHEYFESVYGNGGNFMRSAQHRIESMRNLDTALGQMVSARHYRVLGSAMARFAMYAPRDEQEVGRFVTKLEEVGNDTFRLVEERAQSANERTAELRIQVGQLQQEISLKIQRTSEELNSTLEESRARVLRDLARVASLEAESEQMSTALESVLKKVEGEIVQMVKTTEMRISEETATLRDLLEKVGQLNSVY